MNKTRPTQSHEIIYLRGVQNYTEQNHLLGNLEREDFEVMLTLLKDQGEVFIDENHWIVAGWQSDETHINPHK